MVRVYDVVYDDFAGMVGYTVVQRLVFIVDGDGIIRYWWVVFNLGVELDYDEV